MAHNDRDNASKNILSPEELIERLESLEQPEVILEARQIPTYKVIRNYSLIFLIGLIAAITLLMNLDKFGYHYYNMLSGSMEDRIPKGSLIIEKEVPPNQLKKGDIITFTNESGISVTHEIINIMPSYEEAGALAFETKGSNNEVADSELVEEEQILGKVIVHIPVLGKTLMHRR